MLAVGHKCIPKTWAVQEYSPGVHQHFKSICVQYWQEIADHLRMT